MLYMISYAWSHVTCATGIKRANVVNLTRLSWSAYERLCAYADDGCLLASLSQTQQRP